VRRLGTLHQCPCVIPCDLITCYGIESAWFRRLKVKCDELLSIIVVNLNLYRCTKGWSMTPPLRAATRVEGGRVNDPTAGPTKRWTVELAMPVGRLLENTMTGGGRGGGGGGAARSPAHGDFWRINFSRVEWHVVEVDGRQGRDIPPLLSCICH